MSKKDRAAQLEVGRIGGMKVDRGGAVLLRDVDMEGKAGTSCMPSACHRGNTVVEARAAVIIKTLHLACSFLEGSVSCMKHADCSVVEGLLALSPPCLLLFVRPPAGSRALPFTLPNIYTCLALCSAGGMLLMCPRSVSNVRF